MQEVLSGREEFGQMHLPIIERSKVAKLGDLFRNGRDLQNRG